MGFSSMASQVIMFISVLVIATALVIYFNNYSTETLDTANLQRQELSDRLSTDINIDVIDVDNTTNPHTLSVYVKNTGKIPVGTDYLDLYVDNNRIPRDTQNRTLGIVSDTDTTNTGVWDPKELVLVKIFYNVSSSERHNLRIILDNGIKDTKEFTT